MKTQSKPLNPLGVTHRQRVSNFAACLRAVGAPVTADHCRKLAAPHYTFAKKVRGRPQTERVRRQRFGALVSARAFFALARQVAV